MNNQQPQRIKTIHNQTNEVMSKYLDKNNLLKSSIEKDLNHNPMINDDIGGTLADIEAVMDFISKLILETNQNTNRVLEPYEQTVIHLLSNSAIKALQFEQKRADFMMLKPNQGEL